MHPNTRKFAVNFTPAVFLALMIVWPDTALAQGTDPFADAKLEHAVRDALNKPTGDLTSADLLRLTSLTAPNYRITSLSGLQSATNLRYLNVAQNDITNAAALAGMPQLTSLDLSWNYIRDLSFLPGLTNLDSLFLTALSLEAVPPLGKMPRLVRLGLGYNHISDPAPLGGLTSLRELDMTANRISSVTSLCGMTNLQSLVLGELAVTNAECLSCFTQLVNLGLYDNSIPDLTPLLGLTNLQSLDLSANPVSDWTPVARFTNLVSLDIRGAALTNVNWLAEMRNLSYLGLAQNSITDLSPLRALTNLLSLDLSRNPVTNFTTLAAPNLQVLHLDGSSLTDIRFMAGLHHLIGLSLLWNQVSDLAPLGGLTNLLWLEASYNALTNISALRDLPSLQTVYLNGNLLDLTPGSDAMGVIQGVQSKGVFVYYQPQLEPPQILVRPQWLVPAGQKSWLKFMVGEGAYSWVRPPTVGAHSSDPGLLPDGTFATTPPYDWSYWDLGVTAAADKSGTVSLTLSVTNYAGLWTNVTVQVQVAPPAPFPGDCLDAGGGLTWGTMGAPPWFSQSAVSHDGRAAAQSGAINSFAQTTVTGPGTLKFWFKLGSTYFYANGQFSATAQDSDLHGYKYLSRCGESWQEQTLGFPAGTWVLKWSPVWDAWDFAGENNLWLDQVSFVPGSPACWFQPTVRVTPNGARELGLNGATGQSYDVEVSDDLRNWSPLTRVKCENFVAEIRDWAGGSGLRFYRAKPVVE